MDVALGFLAARRPELLGKPVGTTQLPGPTVDLGLDGDTGRDRTGPTTTSSTTPVEVGAGRDCTGVRTGSQAGLTAKEANSIDKTTDPTFCPTDSRPGWIRHQLSGREMARAKDLEDARYETRVRGMDDDDERLLSKYLPSDAGDVFNATRITEADNDEIPQWLALAVKVINETDEEVPDAPPFKFDLTMEAAQFNACTIQRYSGGLKMLLEDHRETTIGFGREFRHTNRMDALFCRHPSYKYFRKTLRSGMKIHLTRELSVEEKKAQKKLALEYGNHKSAQSKTEEVLRLLRKDVIHGFAVPITKGMVADWDEAEVQPIGVVEQATVGEGGARKVKCRMTHDNSFNYGVEGMSINERQLTNCLGSTAGGLSVGHMTSPLSLDSDKSMALLFGVEYRRPQWMLPFKY